MFKEPESKIALAHKYMVSRHGLQKRKTGEYYTTHPTDVASLVLKYKARSYKVEDYIIAAFLHDVIEDTDGYYEEIKELFGEFVADLVQEVTSISREAMVLEGESKKTYLAVKMEKMTEGGLFLKLLDRLDNIKKLEDTQDTFKYRQLRDTEYILAYLYKERRFITRTHHMIMRDIQLEMDKLCPKPPIATEMDVLIGELRLLGPNVLTDFLESRKSKPAPKK